MSLRLFVACLLIAMIGGCASPGVRPGDANVFQAAGNLATGEFDKQLERDKLDLSSSEQQLEQEQATSTSLGVTLDSRRAEKEELERNLVLLGSKNDALENEIRSIEAATATRVKARNQQLARLAGIRKEIDKLAEQIAASAIDSEYYRIRIERLSREIEILRGVALNQ